MNKHLLLEHVKRLIRLGDALLATGRTVEHFRGLEFPLVRTRFWSDTEPANFAAEIHPYFDHMPAVPDYPLVVDSGAASGQFTVAFGLTHPASRIVAFEPSPRQRILLRRNLVINGLTGRSAIQPFGLWNADTTLAFRTHGALSSLAGASQIPDNFLFAEKVEVIRLDDWMRSNPLPRLDLVKMDIEGAEIEALEGMTATLARYRPALLVQAYHLREGVRTLERCEDFLRARGYTCREAESSGLLIATPV